VLLLAACWLAACRESSAEPSSPTSPSLGAAGAIADLPPTAAPVRPTFCDRAGDDAIRDAFCSGALAPVRSLRALQALLDIEPAPPDTQPNIGDPYRIKFVAVLGHSTSLSGRFVSPINPRVIVLGKDTVSAFQRGVHHVELASRDRTRTDGSYNFYLVRFERACSTVEGGCTNADLFTPRLESDWVGLEIRDEHELENTPSDCRQCHRRSRDAGILLMRELRQPWTHFFEAYPAADVGALLPGVRGKDLTLDYLRAKDDELYGNAALHSLPVTSAFILQSVVAPAQPLLFDSRAIEEERWPYRAEGYAAEPKPTTWWNDAYAAFKRGEQLALPYYDQRASDPGKQARLTEAYVQFRSGALSADELPDFADIFPDDPHVRAQIGLQTEPDATPPEALIQACGSCHNDVLDQTLSRARFNIDLSKLGTAELANAVERLGRPSSASGAMPPPDARQLDPETRARLIEYLEQYPRTRTPEPMLEHAAKVGMMGGADPRPGGDAYP